MRRLSLVHDYLYVYGGAERMLEHVHTLWPAAPIYTLLYLPEQFPSSFHAMEVRTTWVNRLPARLRLQRAYAMLQPVAFGALQPGGDVVSLASFGAKAVQPRESGRHVCYCFTPPRFLWGPFSGIERDRLAAPVRLPLRALERVLRAWDLAAARRVSAFVTLSEYVARRIGRVYGRSAEVVYPPVDVARFAGTPAVSGDYYLIIARFEAYKRIDLAIEAAGRLGVPLRIIGGGVDEARLRRLAEGNRWVSFLGQVPDREVVAQLAGCKALLFPGEEDFGLTAVEAQAAGKPVIAYAEGGALETVVEGVTGRFFHSLTTDALAQALATFDPQQFDPQACRTQADHFAPDVFRQRFRAVVERLLEDGRDITGQVATAPAAGQGGVLER